MRLRNEVFEILLDTLNNYQYCILRNYESLPEYQNDIDILVERGNTYDLITFVLN